MSVPREPLAAGIAATLVELARRLTVEERFEEALAVSSEAVAAYSELAAAEPDTYASQLSAALGFEAMLVALTGEEGSAL